MGWAWGEFGAVAGPVDDELVGAVGETVEGGVGEDGVGEEPYPLGNVAIRSDDEAGAAVALDDEGVEVFRLLLVEPLETEVIDDKQVPLRPRHRTPPPGQLHRHQQPRRFRVGGTLRRPHARQLRP